MNPIRERNSSALGNALPGTSATLATRTGLGIGTVRKYLRCWLELGSITRYAHFVSQHGYTWVYEDCPKEKSDG